MNRNYGISILISIFLVTGIDMFALEGKFNFKLTKKENLFTIPNRGYYNNSQIKVKVSCHPGTKVQIGWLLRLSECIDEFYLNTNQLPNDIFQKIYKRPNIVLQDYPFVQYQKPALKEYTCDPDTEIIDLFNVDPVKIITEKTDSIGRKSNNEDLTPISILTRKRRASDKKTKSPLKANQNFTKNQKTETIHPHDHQDIECIAKTWKEGSFLFVLYSKPVNDKDYSLDVTLSISNKESYLPANDWPFLPFYAIMCAVYSLYALFWLVCSCAYWRDLLRLQLWIGAVILLGLMEKAAYLSEYETINRTGQTTKFAMIIAEIISSFKRSLARMLVIIVSLGFGIVKPRLGPTMQKVVGLGAVYFILAVIDGVFRIMGRKEDTDNKGVLAGVPLVVIDVSICYWILCNLQQTMRTLKVRRNIPKLSLYRHFTNTLIFSVIASVVFMAWSLKRHRFVDCLRSWQELWLDEAFWHIQFSFILLVIIILWRPSKNSQRFAFTPLLDNEEDADEMDDVEYQETEIFDSIKMRQKVGEKKEKLTEDEKNKKAIEDDLKWVEENVPATLIETAMPTMNDSEEELMTTKFEASKMD